MIFYSPITNRFCLSIFIGKSPETHMADLMPDVYKTLPPPVCPVSDTPQINERSSRYAERKYQEQSLSLYFAIKFYLFLKNFKDEPA